MPNFKIRTNKSKDYPTTGHEGPEREYIYSCGRGWLTPHSGRFVPRKETQFPLYRRLDGPQGRSGRVQKFSLPSWFDPRTFQAVASRYTDYVILARKLALIIIIIRYVSGLTKEVYASNLLECRVSSIDLCVWVVCQDKDCNWWLVYWLFGWFLCIYMAPVCLGCMSLNDVRSGYNPECYLHVRKKAVFAYLNVVYYSQTIETRGNPVPCSV